MREEADELKGTDAYQGKYDMAMMYQWMSTNVFAKEVLKWHKCYGYAEVYAFGVLSKKYEEKAAGTYEKDTFEPIIDGFASGKGKMPTQKDLGEIFTSKKRPNGRRVRREDDDG